MAIEMSRPGLPRAASGMQVATATMSTTMQPVQYFLVQLAALNLFGDHGDGDANGGARRAEREAFKGTFYYPLAESSRRPARTAPKNECVPI